MATKRRLTAEERWRQLRRFVETLNANECYLVERHYTGHLSGLAASVSVLKEMRRLQRLSKPQPRSRRKA